MMMVRFEVQGHPAASDIQSDLDHDLNRDLPVGNPARGEARPPMRGPGSKPHWQTRPGRPPSRARALQKLPPLAT